MNAPRSDGRVIFGASGDLAYKKIFPALQAMMRRGISRGRLLGDAMAGDATLFGVVKAAQARGNFQILAGRGRRCVCTWARMC